MGDRSSDRLTASSLTGPVYARIDADRMFTFHTTPDSD